MSNEKTIKTQVSCIIFVSPLEKRFIINHEFYVKKHFLTNRLFRFQSVLQKNQVLQSLPKISPVQQKMTTLF